MPNPKSSHVEVDVEKLPFQEAYKLIIGSIVPRPIAWVSTVNKSGVSNLAPFSFFNGVCSNPPSVLFCPVNTPEGREKDTLVNIRDNRQFVVNLVSRGLAEKMNQTSANYPFGISEFKEAGLTEGKCKKVKPPRVLEAPISMECELIEIVKVGPGGPGSGAVVIGKILHMHFDPAVYKDGKILIEAFDPIARLAGSAYCPVRDIFTLDRPKL
ncbi:MAG TPA: flavin reductase family protein [Oligoflexia bacterium]|nr:flavin reductase family protein [Oligoflexia bacterium]